VLVDVMVDGTVMVGKAVVGDAQRLMEQFGFGVAVGGIDVRSANVGIRLTARSVTVTPLSAGVALRASNVAAKESIVGLSVGCMDGSGGSSVGVSVAVGVALRIIADRVRSCVGSMVGGAGVVGGIVP
jgi:hypothetical protein